VETNSSCQLSKTIYLNEECLHDIKWHAVDALGNVETEHSQFHKVDNTPPHILILKPVDGWYSDGEDIPVVAVAQDLSNSDGPCHGLLDERCAVGIENGKQCNAYLLDILPEFKAVALESHMLYNADAHECQGYVTLNNTGSKIPDGVVFLVVSASDNLGNEGNSLMEIMNAIGAKCGGGMLPRCIRDVVQDIVTIWNLPKIGIDNHAPVVTITKPTAGSLFGGVQVYFSADVTDANDGEVTSTITSGTPCYVTLGGVSLGTVPYSNADRKCEGTMMIPDDKDFPQGTQQLTVEIADNAGNVGKGSVNVNVDTVDPIVAFIAPDANTFVSGNVNVQFTISDDNIDASTARLSLDNGNSWVTPTCIPGTCSYSWDTTTATDGMAYEMLAKVSDLAGNEAHDERIVIVDNGLPESIVITYPYHNQYLSGPITIEAVTGDAVSGIQTVSFYRCSDGYSDPSHCWLIGQDFNPEGGWTIGFDACSSPSTTGLYAEVWDHQGNTLDSTLVPVTVDCTAPTVTVNAPTGTLSGYQTISATVPGDVVSVQFEISSTYYVLCYDEISPYTCRFDTRAFSNGIHWIYATAKDRAGLTSTNQTQILVDNTPPTLTISTALSASNNQFVKGTQTIITDVYDTHLDSSSVMISTDNGETWNSAYACDPDEYCYNWNTTTATDGMAYGILAKASDTAGNTGYSLTITLIPDNKAMTSMVVVLPLTGSAVKGTTPIEAVASDSVSGTQRVEFYVDGSYVGTDANYADGWRIEWNSASVSDGAHSVYVRGYDNVGNTRTSSTVSFIVDNYPPTAPTISVVDPNENGYDNDGVVTWRWTDASDTGSGVDYYELTVSSSPEIVTQLIGNYFTTSDLIDGTYTAKVRAVDKIGNVGPWSNIATIKVDTTAPAVDILTPANNQFVNGTQEIRVQVSDTNLDTSSIRVSTDNGQTWQTVTSCDGDYCYSWDTTIATDGMAYGIIAKSTDLAGNTGYSAPVIVIVDNGEPEGVYVVDPIKNDIVKGTTELKALATDYVSGVQSVKIYVSSIGWNCDATLTGGTWQCSFDSTSLPDGVHEVYAEAKDILGQITTSVSVPFTIDNNPPSTPVISVTDPDGDGYDTDGIVTWSWTTSTDAGSGVAYYEFTASDKPGDVSTKVLGNFLTTSDLIDGTYTAKVRAVDRAGHASEWSEVAVITVDTIPPEKTIIQPVQGWYVNTLPINITAIDESAGVDDSMVYFNITHEECALFWCWDVNDTSGILDNYNKPYYNYTVDISGLVEGRKYKLTITACDNLGHCIDPSIFFGIDKTAPTWPSGAKLTVTYSPYDKDGNVSLSWPATSDALSGVDHYNIYLNGTLNATTNSTTYSYLYINLSDGLYNFNVTPVDAVGNENSGLTGSTTIDGTCTVDGTCTPSAPAESSGSGSTTIIEGSNGGGGGLIGGGATTTLPPQTTTTTVGGGAGQTTTTVPVVTTTTTLPSPLSITGLITLVAGNSIYQILIALAIIALLITIFRHRIFGKKINNKPRKK
jgi:hypothetical protein